MYSPVAAMSSDDLSKIPAVPAPPGQVSNFIDPPSRAWMPRVAIYATLPIAIAFVFLRLGACFQLRQMLRWDDYFCIAAFFAIVGHSTALLLAFSNDIYGRHLWDIPFSAIKPVIQQLTVAIIPLLALANLFTKLSLLVLFYRLFSPNPCSRIVTIVGTIFVVVSYPVLAAAWIYYTVPREGETEWLDPEYENRLSKVLSPLTVSLGALGTFTDLYIIAIPFISVSGLKLSQPKKFGVLGLFATGLLATAFSIASLVSRIPSSVFISGVPDPFWTSIKALAFGAAEIHLGIVCACVPVAFPLLKIAAKRLACIIGSTDSEAPTSPDSIQRLPSVPKGTLNTLLSFARGSHRARHKDSQGILVTGSLDVEMAPYQELDSIETDYNKFIRNSHPQSRPNLVGNTADAREVSRQIQQESGRK